jgi:hypothetical protein
MDKQLYKIEIWLLKVLPFILAIICFISTLFNVLGHTIPILAIIADVSIIPLLFLYVSSYVFKFCEWHRVPLHYIATTKIFNLIDYWFLPHVTNHIILIVYCLIFGLFSIMCGILKRFNKQWTTEK